MAIVLASKPGLSSTTTLHIPKDWDPTWFRNFISNQLKGADVRNAVGANGIVVSGNISSPYATISLGGTGPVTIPFPVTITPPAGTVGLTINGATGQQAEVVNGDVTINAASSTVGLTINAAAGQYGELINGGSFAGISFVSSGGTFATNDLYLFQNTGVGQSFLGTRSATVLNFQTNSLTRLSISGAGTVTVSAPTSGTALVVNGLAGAYATTIQAPNTAGAAFGLYIQAGTNSSDVALQINNAANSVAYFKVTGDGGVAVGSGAGDEGAGTVNVNSAYYVAGAKQPVFLNTAILPLDTGWGTPTNNTVTNNFPGTGATLAQTGGAVASILLILKSLGVVGA